MSSACIDPHGTVWPSTTGKPSVACLIASRLIPHSPDDALIFAMLTPIQI